MENLLLFAQGGLAPAGIVQWVIILIVLAGVIGVAFIVTRQAGITIPPFVIQIFWVLLACIIGVVAIRYLAGLL